jgi:hypothetical protein
LGTVDLESKNFELFKEEKMSLSKHSRIEEPRNSINDIPLEILQKNFFEHCFNLWERLVLEQVSKRWKHLMPYRDSHLNVIDVCEKISKFFHDMGLIRSTVNPRFRSPAKFFRKKNEKATNKYSGMG